VGTEEEGVGGDRVGEKIECERKVLEGVNATKTEGEVAVDSSFGEINGDKRLVLCVAGNAGPVAGVVVCVWYPVLETLVFVLELGVLNPK